MVQSPGQNPRPRRALAMTSASIFRFGPFELNTCAQELSKNGTRIRLRGQPFSILEILLSRAGEVVTREEIRQKLWPADTFVDFEHGLNTSIKKLRQALCDSATEPRYIETLPRRGYRFIAPVKEIAEPGRTKSAAAGETISAIPATRESGTPPPIPGSFAWSSLVTGRLHFFVPAVAVLAAAALALNVARTRDQFFALF